MLVYWKREIILNKRIEMRITAVIATLIKVLLMVRMYQYLIDAFCDNITKENEEKLTEMVRKPSFNTCLYIYILIDLNNHEIKTGCKPSLNKIFKIKLLQHNFVRPLNLVHSLVRFSKYFGIGFHFQLLITAR